MSQFEQLAGVLTKEQILDEVRVFDEAEVVECQYKDIEFVMSGDNDVSLNIDRDNPVVLGSDSLDHMASKVGFPHKYLGKIPRDRWASMVLPHLNYWYPQMQPETQLRLLVDGSRRSILSIPNADFEHINVSELIGGIEGVLGGHNIIGYHKPRFNPKGFQFSLLTDHTEQVINDHIYNAGIRVTHSIDALGATKVEPYLFNQWCSNGCTHEHELGAWRRRGAKLGLSTWLQETVLDSVMLFDQEVTNLQRLAGIPFPSEGTEAVNKMLHASRVPNRLQVEVHEQLLNDGAETMYDLYQSLTAVETHNEYFDEHPNAQGRLNAIAAKLSHHSTFCPTCSTQLDVYDAIAQLQVNDTDED